MFWRHLSDAKLIDGNYGATINADTDTGYNPGAPDGTTPIGYMDVNQSLYMPRAKSGKGFFSAINLMGTVQFGAFFSSANAFMISVQGTAAVGYNNQPIMTPIDVFSIDQKIDDGAPYKGKVRVSTYSYSNYSASTNWLNSVGPASAACAYGGSNSQDPTAVYNAVASTGGDKSTCTLLFLW